MEKDMIEEKKCELCKDKATTICFDCSFYLCDSCSKFLHEKKVNSSHIKEDIDPLISMDIKCPKHPKNQINVLCITEKSNILFIIYIFNIELLCSLCCIIDEHDKNHKLIDINDKDSLKSNNISYKESITEFDEFFKKMKNIKQKIEEEIEDINNSHKKIMEEITSSFNDQRFQINKKEKQLKLELDEKVTDVKNDLEICLRESNDIISSFERIYKTIKIYEKKNIILEELKSLYYISEINKNNEIAKELLRKPIKNINIILNKGDVLNYKEYYFNGIPIPKNVEAEKKGENIFIKWDLDDFRTKNFEFKNIKYFLEIKDENQIYKYETFSKNFSFEKYKIGAEYEIKIRSFIDGSYSNWSDIKKFKINDPFADFNYNQGKNNIINPFLIDN